MRREPTLDAVDVVSIAQAQVLVRQALTAGEQTVRKLLGLEPRVALDILEPFGGVARGVLDLEHFERAFRLIGLQRRGHIGVLLQRACQRDRVLQGELGARAHRKMGGVGGVTDEHDRRTRRIADPCLVDDAQEVDPCRAAQVTRVGHQAVAVEITRKEALAKCDRFIRAHPVNARGLPNGLGRLHDERACLAVELVGVRLEPAPFGGLERKGKRLEQPARTEPNVATFAALDFGLKHPLILRPHGAVDAVAGNNEIAVAIHRLVANLGLEYQLYAKLLAALLQNIQEALAADAAKAVSSRSYRPAFDVHIDVVPVTERIEDRGVGWRIGCAQIA